MRDALSDEVVERNHQVPLGPWDVRILIEE